MGPQRGKPYRAPLLAWTPSAAAGCSRHAVRHVAVCAVARLCCCLLGARLRTLLHAPPPSVWAGVWAGRREATCCPAHVLQPVN